MAKPCKSFYSAPIEITGSPGRYYGSFGVPGEKPHWVIRDGVQAEFDSYDEAEIAGFRSLSAKLNGARVVQDFRAKGTSVPLVTRRQETPRPKRKFLERPDKGPSLEQVFANFA